MKRVIVISLCVVLLIFAVAALAEKVPSMSCSPEEVVVLLNKTSTLRVSYSDKAYAKAGTIYQSSDDSIATVDKSGKIKGISEGTCFIYTTSKKDENLNSTIPVSVIIPVNKLQAILKDKQIHVGESTEIVCSFGPENASWKECTYKSASEKIAVVDQNGIVTGKSKGNTTIIVTSLDGAAKASISVTVLQPAESIRITPETPSVTTGKTIALKAEVLPKDTNNKGVVWTVSDESIATINEKGQLKAIMPGDVIVTAASKDQPDVFADIMVHCIQLASSVTFAEKQYDVIVGDRIQLETEVLPANTTDQRLTYKVKNPKICTVDENGVVTALKGGKTTITATCADGSKHHASVTVQVVIPIEDVYFDKEGCRVAVGGHTYVTAQIIPANATYKDMIWEIEDPSVATTKGSTNKIRVNGRVWGRTTLTGTTVDGGYSASISINVGSLRRAVTVQTLEIRNGKPYIVLKNHSNMDITAVYFQIYGCDCLDNPIHLTRRSDVMNCSYLDIMEPGETTHHGRFQFYNATHYDPLDCVNLVITGWETSTGYYDNDGYLCYSYTIPSSQRETVTAATNAYRQLH